MTTSEDEKRFVGRGGLKLDYALDEFAINVTGKTAADFGCNVGGFTDCLLQRGAKQVYAIDTGYGMLDYNLRRDERVVVMERTNVLHCDPPSDGVDVVVIDAGWTPQNRVLPVAIRWLGDRTDGLVISLVKPHYEATAAGRQISTDKRGVLDEDEARRVLDQVLEDLAQIGHEPVKTMRSPVLGGRGKRKRGNVEFMVLFRPLASGSPTV